MALSCFIFECYCQGRMLFRACSESSGLLDPLPDSALARALQAEAIKNGLRLTYSFIANGMTKAEAAVLMRTLAADEPQSAADFRPPVEVEWLPSSGVCRLAADRSGRFYGLNSTPVPLKN